MTVYVDDFFAAKQIRTYRTAIWSHLTVGPYDDIDELHTFARQLGLSRSWFQGPPEHPWPRSHYDVTKTRRLEAIRAGAVAITWKQGGRQRIRAAEAWRAAAQTPTGPLPPLVPGSLLWVEAKALYELAEAREGRLS